MEKQNKIFLDLDETLIHSYYCNNDATVEYYINEYSENYGIIDYSLGPDAWSEGDRYVTVIRPMTFKLLNLCENLVGWENVYILTLGTIDYARTINRLAGFDVPHERIFTRESLFHIQDEFKNTNNILIDNESYSYHLEGDYNKVNFLHGLAKEKYVNILGFWPDLVDRHKNYYSDLNLLEKQIIAALEAH